jgi:radical SAM superfamily enzyme YgiQ (UPF0313 family)
VDNVIEELKMAKEKYGVKRFYFVEDFFIHDLVWMREFCGKYRRFVSLPFICAGHPSHINEEIVALLEKANCLELSMGIQTISEALRKQNLCRDVSNQEIKSAISQLKRTKIFLNVDVILGIPGQDAQELVDMAVFLNTYRPDAAIIFPLRYYPKTGIVDVARKNNILKDADVREIEKKGSLSAKGNRSVLPAGMARLGDLVFMSPFIPSSLLKLIVRKKLYAYFPKNNKFFLRLLSVSVVIKKFVFERKKKLTLFLLMTEMGCHLRYIHKWLVSKVRSMPIFDLAVKES